MCPTLEDRPENQRAALGHGGAIPGGDRGQAPQADFSQVETEGWRGPLQGPAKEARAGLVVPPSDAGGSSARRLNPSGARRPSWRLRRRRARGAPR